MKRVICILFFYISCCCCFAQINNKNQLDSSKIVVASDYFLDIEFDFDSIQPTDYGLRVLNRIGNILSTNKEMKDEFWFVFQIAASMKEQRANTNLEFKRMLFVLDYLKQNYNIENNFLFAYWDTHPSEFCMRFSLRNKY